MRFIYPFIVGSVLLQLVSFVCIAILLQSEHKSLGVLTVYSGDIFYIDLDKMHVGSESGKYDLTFENFSHLSGWLEEATAHEINQSLTYELHAALGSCQAKVTPGGVALETFNQYTRDTVSLLLDRTKDNQTFYFID
jgi:hypothetical protein